MGAQGKEQSRFQRDCRGTKGDISNIFWLNNPMKRAKGERERKRGRGKMEKMEGGGIAVVIQLASRTREARGSGG